VVLGGVVTLAAVGTAVGFGIFAKQSAQDSANSAAGAIVDYATNKDPNHPPIKGLCDPGTQAHPNPNYSKYAAACGALNDDNDHVNKDATIANVAIGVAVAGTVFTVLYGVLGTKRHTTGSLAPTITPIAGKGLGGMALGASF
jgi:hypothetical protein